jgi:hypothetical protein
MPKRIQRKRTKGWKMPEGAVYVGRPTIWGNPFKVGGYFAIGKMGMIWCQAREQQEGFTLIESPIQAVDMFRHLRTMVTPYRTVAELRGKDLACWCPLDQPCHADVLLEIANG